MNVMKKVLKTIGIAALVIVILSVALVAWLVITFLRDSKIQEEDQLLMVKSDEELLGEHIYIKRDGKGDVDVNYYFGDGESLPLVINLHGGAFIAGDADTLDTQSDRISKSWGVNVAAVNYSLLKNGIEREYVIEEITDTVRYFIENKDAYHVDPDNIFIMGYSAGGFYAAASTLELQRSGIAVKGQILCYAFINGVDEQFITLTEQERAAMSPALFVVAKGAPLGEGSLAYEKLLHEAGVLTDAVIYDGVKHGFIEENNPEYEKLHDKNKASKSEEAEKVAREAEDYIGNWIKTVSD